VKIFPQGWNGEKTYNSHGVVEDIFTLASLVLDAWPSLVLDGSTQQKLNWRSRAGFTNRLCGLKPRASRSKRVSSKLW